jgi:peroxiredoxin
MKYRLVLIAIVLAAFAAAFASASEGVMAIGTKLDGFSMADPAGTVHSYNDLKGKNGTLMIFLSAQCPVVAGYNDRINQLAADYEAKGIRMVGVYSNATEDLAWVTRHSKENYKFTVLIDENNVFADKLGASFTPEVYYFNTKDVLDYHGAIDNDRYGRNITKQFLKTALDEKLGGGSISVQDTRAFGCTIKRVKGDG